MDRLIARFDASLTLIARLFMALLFLMAGVGGIIRMDTFQAKLTGDGLPALIYAPVVWFLIISALMLAFGFKTRWVAVLLSGFSLLSGLIDYTDFLQPTDMVMLLKNIALTGGYLFVAVHGPGPMSVDAAMARHTVPSRARLAPPNPAAFRRSPPAKVLVSSRAPVATASRAKVMVALPAKKSET